LGANAKLLQRRHQRIDEGLPLHILGAGDGFPTGLGRAETLERLKGFKLAQGTEDFKAFDRA
jgi:hypothetical protein